MSASAAHNGSRRVPRINDIFSAEERAVMREALEAYRSPGAYSPGRWMVSALNRADGIRPAGLPSSVRLRDITLRTMEQMPGVSATSEERRDLACRLARAGIDDIVLSSFRRGHPLDEVRADVAAVRAINPNCRLSFGNAVKIEELDFAAAAGLDEVEVWTAVYLGKAMPVSAGAVYHRVWQDRDWRQLNFPESASRHMERARRLIAAAREREVEVTAVINLVAFATESYAREFAAAMAAEGASTISLADSSGGMGPEAFATLVRAVHEAAPGCSVGIHAHNALGMGIGNSIAAVAAGAEVVEVAVNGYEVGPGGTQAPLAATAVAFEALYGVATGVDLSAMTELARAAERMTPYPIPWSEPLIGSGANELAAGDEYVMELQFDELIHSAVSPELVGQTRYLGIGPTTGPFSLATKLDQLGIEVNREQVESILEAARAEIGESGRPLSDERLRALAAKVTAPR